MDSAPDTRRPVLNVLVLSDGRPGHYNKSKALLRALSFHYEVQASWHEVRLRSGMLRPLLSFWLNLLPVRRSLSLLKAFYSFDRLPASSPDLIISVGGNTLFANAWLARIFRCRNLFIGSLRHLRPRLFWRILTHKPLTPAPPYLHWPTTPVNIHPDDLAVAADALRGERDLGDGPLWTLLIGGDGGGYHYGQADWAGLADMMERAHRQLGVRWLVISSRRTGKAHEAAMQALLDPGWLAASSWSSEDGGSRYHAFLGAADCIVCTEDSHMMLTEAIASGKPVLSVRPARGQPSNRAFLDLYVDNGYILRASIAQAADAVSTLPEHGARDFSPQLEQLGQCLADELASTDQ